MPSQRLKEKDVVRNEKGELKVYELGGNFFFYESSSNFEEENSTLIEGGKEE